MPDPSIIAEMLAACGEHYRQLVTGGCEESIALDRTWDAYECAFLGGDAHCFDPRDRLLENRLRTIKERG